MHGFGMGWGWIIGLTVIVAIIWILFKMNNQNIDQKVNDNKTALDILKQRYAKGEINKKEFEEKKSTLNG